MKQPALFGPEEMPVDTDGEAQPRAGEPRLVRADREQMQLLPVALDDLLPADHVARAMVAVVEQLDLSAFYAVIEARGSDPGRPATDPKILVSLWLYATSDGVGSAREVARLCQHHDAYRWICGGVSVNHHTLSDFRVGHAVAVDGLMTQVLAVLMRQGLVKLRRVAQDGMRVRASAGAASFRREKSLHAALKAARQHVEEVKRQAESESGAGRTARQNAAAERAARLRQERIARALAELPKAQAAKEKKDRDQARVSTTDSEARVMKMGDGGFRPAYNVQLATATEGRVIVGVGVTNVGSDMAQSEPMLEDIERRTGERPAELLVDGGFAKLESIEHAGERGTTVYAPVPAPRVEGIDPHQPKNDDSETVAAWRQRMGTPEAKEIYKQRAATAETVNADLRTWRGLDRLPVRGASKVLTVVLWAACTYNVLRWVGAMNVTG